MQTILQTAQQFYNMCDISINPNKTEVIHINSKSDPSIHLKYKNDDQNLKILEPTESTKYLGIHISANGKFHTQQAKIKIEVDNLTKLLTKKFITEKQSIYIINRVLFPAIEYRSQLFVLSDTFCENIMRKIKKLVKIKAFLPEDTPNSILYHPKIFALDNIQEIQSRSKISDLFYRLNEPSLTGHITNIRLQQLQHNR